MLTSTKSRIVRSSTTSLVNSCLLSFSALLRATITSSAVFWIANVLTKVDVSNYHTQGSQIHTNNLVGLTNAMDTLSQAINHLLAKLHWVT